MPHPRTEDLSWDRMSIRDVLELAIADEEEARDYYRRASELTGNLHTRRVLVELSQMEQGHADQLRKELDDLVTQSEMEAGIAD